jgi:hypothetical protein
MNDSGGRFALARPRLLSRHGAARREMITAHRLRAPQEALGMTRQSAWERFPGEE